MLQIMVIAGGERQKNFQDKEIPEGVLIQFFADINEVKKDADGYFYLLTKEDIKRDIEVIKQLPSPVFIIEPLSIDTLPLHVAFIEDWPKFLFSDKIKVQYHKEKKAELESVLHQLQWKFDSDIH